MVLYFLHFLFSSHLQQTLIDLFLMPFSYSIFFVFPFFLFRFCKCAMLGLSEMAFQYAVYCVYGYADNEALQNLKSL